MNSEEIFYDVSVPYRGATFLNSFICYFRNFSVDCFRPLSGSYISQLRTKFKQKGEMKVSVPYRGATFLNRIRFFTSMWNLSKVSVPYRGATFLNPTIILIAVF